MSTRQSYSGGGSHANPNEQTAQNATLAGDSVTQTAPPADLTPPPAESQQQGSLPVEDLTQFGRDIFKNPKPNLSFSLDVLNNGRYGNSHAVVLLWALRNHQDLLRKETLDSLKGEAFEEAYDWLGELDNCNELLFDVALGLAGLAEQNYWATHNQDHNAYAKDVFRTAQQNKDSYERFLSEVVGLSLEDAESVEAHNLNRLKQKLSGDGKDLDAFRETLEQASMATLKDILLACKTNGTSSDAERDMILDEIHKRIADL